MPSLTDSEAHAFLRSLFPGGLRDGRLLAELTPEGWESSPLFACFHPPPAMAYREYLAHRETMRSLDLGMSRRKGKPDSDAPPFEEPELGSFRGTAAEIADFFEESPAGKEDEDKDEGDEHEDLGGRRERSDYMRFYMGAIWVGGRADLAPVYRLIFQRLHACGADWRDSFPRLRLFSAGEISDHAGVPHDPSAAVADEIERAARKDKLRRMRTKLDRANLAAQREARSQPPPDTVRAYQEIYGRFPAGWPPDPYRLD